MVLKVFFSWQEETNPQGVNNKQFLIGSIGSAPATMSIGRIT